MDSIFRITHSANFNTAVQALGLIQHIATKKHQAADRFYRTLCRGEAFQKTMGTAEFHHLVGKYLAEREEQTGRAGSISA